MNKFKSVMPTKIVEESGKQMRIAQLVAGLTIGLSLISARAEPTADIGNQMRADTQQSLRHFYEVTKGKKTLGNVLASLRDTFVPQNFSAWEAKFDKFKLLKLERIELRDGNHILLHFRRHIISLRTENDSRTGESLFFINQKQIDLSDRPSAEELWNRIDRVLPKMNREAAVWPALFPVAAAEPAVSRPAPTEVTYDGGPTDELRGYIIGNSMIACHIARLGDECSRILNATLSCNIVRERVKFLHDVTRDAKKRENDKNIARLNFQRMIDREDASARLDLKKGFKCREIDERIMVLIRERIAEYTATDPYEKLKQCQSTAELQEARKMFGNLQPSARPPFEIDPHTLN